MNIINIKEGFKNNSLEQRLVQIYGYNKGSEILNELMNLGFLYSFYYPETFNLDLTRGFFYLDKYLNNSFNWYKNIFFREYNFSNWLKTFKKNSFFIFNNYLFKIFNQLNPISNPIKYMVLTNSRSNENQLKQLIFFRGFILDNNNYYNDMPILSNFIKGLNFSEYILSLYGARKGLLDTALKTSESGYLTRKLIEVIQDCVIKEKNWYSLSFMSSKTFHSLKGNLKNLEFYIIFSKEIKTKIIKKFCKEIFFKSLLTCISGRSICKTCLGSLYKINSLYAESLGVIAAESLGEPCTQLTLRTFHTGGVLFLKSSSHSVFSYKTKKFFFNKKYISLYNKDNNNFKNYYYFNFKIYLNINIKNYKKYFKSLNLSANKLFILKNLNQFKYNNIYIFKYKLFFNIYSILNLILNNIKNKYYKKINISYNTLFFLFLTKNKKWKINNYGITFSNNHLTKIFIIGGISYNKCLKNTKIIIKKSGVRCI